MIELICEQWNPLCRYIRPRIRSLCARDGTEPEDVILRIAERANRGSGLARAICGHEVADSVALLFWHARQECRHLVFRSAVQGRPICTATEDGELERIRLEAGTAVEADPLGEVDRNFATRSELFDACWDALDRAGLAPPGVVLCSVDQRVVYVFWFLVRAPIDEVVAARAELAANPRANDGNTRQLVSVVRRRVRGWMQDDAGR
ncbi:MAG: hypothetical protein OEY23_12375 [Acidimicrobiia bacterium]|nr:hypothetical protein [Acidimicrobiia bacterium]